MDAQIAQSKVLADMSEMMRTLVAGKTNPAEDPEVLAAVARQAGCTDKGELSFELEKCNVAMEKIQELVEDVLERIDLLTGTCTLWRHAAEGSLPYCISSPDRLSSPRHFSSIMVTLTLSLSHTHTHTYSHTPTHARAHTPNMTP